MKARDWLNRAIRIVDAAAKLPTSDETATSIYLMAQTFTLIAIAEVLMDDEEDPVQEPKDNKRDMKTEYIDPVFEKMKEKESDRGSNKRE